MNVKRAIWDASDGDERRECEEGVAAMRSERSLRERGALATSISSTRVAMCHHTRAVLFRATISNVNL